MSVSLRLFLYTKIVIVVLLSSLAFGASDGRVTNGPIWAYDPGPDVSTPEGSGYAKLFSEIPNYRAIGEELFPDEHGKFRYAFGPTFYRGRLQKNSVKVLVIGQDGTHIAEAAGRTFTGGTGGRMQHVLDYLGISESYIFINTFAPTIKGQYADFAPVLVDSKGEKKLVWKQFLSPEGYLLAQHPDSPIVQWRNALIEHIIESNKDSLSLIIAVGGAARDTLATFIKSRGGEVGTIIKPEDAKKFQMVRYESKFAGGNRSFFFPVDENGKNILANEGEKFDYKSAKTQNEHTKRANDPERRERLVPMKSGPHENGMLDLAQFGYDLDEVVVDGKEGTLQGLQLKSGKLKSDVRFIGVRHPGVAGGAGDEAERQQKVKQLEEDFQRELSRLKDFAKDGWKLPPDLGMENKLLAGKDFQYGKKPIPRSDFPLGKTFIVIDDNSSAQRGNARTYGKDGANIIEIGGRNAGTYSETDVERALRGKPAEKPGSEDVPWEPSRLDWKNFDKGPGEAWARRLLENLDLEAVYAPKRGKTLRKDGIAALNVKNHPDHGYVGVYRGTFENPEVLVLADPQDYDDLYTARALTGARGQKLQGFLSGLGIHDQYLVLKTAPFDMSGATSAEWKQVLAATREWREALLQNVLKEARPKLILTYGRWADVEIEGIDTGKVPVVSLEDGFDKAFAKIKKLTGWKRRATHLVEKSQSIPRSHLPFGMQLWVGTSGNRVLRERGEAAGIQYQVVVPRWVTDSEAPELNKPEAGFLVSAKKELEENGFEPPKNMCEELLKGA